MDTGSLTIDGECEAIYDGTEENRSVHLAINTDEVTINASIGENRFV